MKPIYINEEGQGLNAAIAFSLMSRFFGVAPSAPAAPPPPSITYADDSGRNPAHTPDTRFPAMHVSEWGQA